MRYANFTDYTDVYFGDELTETDADKWLTRASEELDRLTFGRLERDGMPTKEADRLRVVKAACAVADALFLCDRERKATSAAKDAAGNLRGAIASVSSGRESISYKTSGAEHSADEMAMVICTAARYLAGVAGDDGEMLLYAGVR